MQLIVKLSLIAPMIALSICQRIPDSNEHGISLKKAIRFIMDSRKPRSPLRNLVYIASRKASNLDPDDYKDVQGPLIESELANQKKSALFDRPYVEHVNYKDFLVMHNIHYRDPFVTVIPNNIYYDVEKKCVNWLDDCNLQGIRSRLLRGVQSPYKKKK